MADWRAVSGWKSGYIKGGSGFQVQQVPQVF